MRVTATDNCVYRRIRYANERHGMESSLLFTRRPHTLIPAGFQMILFAISYPIHFSLLLANQREPANYVPSGRCISTEKRMFARLGNSVS